MLCRIRRQAITLAIIISTLHILCGSPVMLVAEERDLPLTQAAKVDYGQPSPLPLPSQTPIEEYESLLFRFLNERHYITLGWRGDKRIRDTGPHIQGRSYGTHPAVRGYYSPEIIAWLVNGCSDPIPDGSMIIKEQFEEPAALHHKKSAEDVWEALQTWTVMVKDSKGSYDGWFWSNPRKGKPPVNEHEVGYPHPVSGFGHYCVRCHSSTTSPGELPEFTFASLRNIEGFPGHPVLFRVDDHWLAKLDAVESERGHEESGDTQTSISHGNHPSCIYLPGAAACVPELSQDFLALFHYIAARPRNEVLKIPKVSYDWAVRAPRDRVANQGFVTSNQCMSCHVALSGDLGSTMIHYTTPKHGYEQPGWDYSPYGEWRWTPMGLAGRDPIFFAQMELELAMLHREFDQDSRQLASLKEGLVETCLRCHGVMGKHQWDLDHAGAETVTKPSFSLDHVYAKAERDELPHENHAHYGALARDGVSCVVCHRLQPREQPAGDTRTPLQFFLETSITGNMTFGPHNEIYGPFQDDEISPYAMEHAMGFTPKYHPYIKSSQMCGTCHTVSLPVVQKPYAEGEAMGELTKSESIPLFRKFKHHVEQATYLEWLNSEYENEYHVDNPNGQSCQDCHMSRDLHVPERGIALDQLRTRIAIIQDDTYPEAENLAPHDKLHVRVREEGYARHNFSGLNVFLIEMFRQFEDILGVPKQDYMTGIEQIDDAVINFLQTASEKTADLTLAADWNQAGQLEARVTVHNKAGHRFPSGVGFRRAFLELTVLDESQPDEPAIVWASGRTNGQGVLIDQDGQPLVTEFFERDPITGKQRYQPHHKVITSTDQVQVYEILLWDVHHNFTTSFVRGCDTVKDNRLLPRGWSRESRHPELQGSFLQATYPYGQALHDPKYADGSGSDEVVYRIRLPEGIDPANVQVRATLYYQAIPPYFLKALFEASPDGPATRRLHYICSNMRLKDTPIEDWKLRIVSQQVAPGRR